MIDPTYSPKLKAAMEEIKAILKKHDIAAFVALHTPEIIEGVQGSDGAVEFLQYLTPSYSAFEIMQNPLGYRIKGNSHLHYGGDKKARDRKLRDTLNMLHMLSNTLGQQAMVLMDISEHGDRVWDAQHVGGSGPTSHQSTQN